MRPLCSRPTWTPGCRRRRSPLPIRTWPSSCTDRTGVRRRCRCAGGPTLSEGDLSEGRAVDIVSLCPPASGECIPAPIHVLRRWLEGTKAIPATATWRVRPWPRDEHWSGDRMVRRRVLLWRGPADSRVIAGPDDLQYLRAGDTVVVPQHLGGWDVFGHIPPDADGNLVIDLGDRAHLQSRARTVLRVHPRLVESWPECPAKTRFVDLARWSEDSEEDVEDADIRQSLADLAGELARMDLDHRWAWLMAAAAALAGDIRLGRLSHPGGGMVLQGSRRLPGFTASTLTSEDDSYSATVPVTMDDHLSGVEGWTRRFAQGLGMPESLVNDLALAARLHDVGKADPRFQAMLRGGHPWAGLAGGPLLAKSGRLPAGRADTPREAATSCSRCASSRAPPACWTPRPTGPWCFTWSPAITAAAGPSPPW